MERKSVMRVWEALFVGTIATPLVAVMFYIIATLVREFGWPELAWDIYNTGYYAAGLYLIVFYIYCGRRILKNRFSR